MHTLDPFDRRILDIVQRDNVRSHQNIGEEVGLSGSAVRRRLIALREAGIIRANVALLDPDLLGTTLLTHITFGIETNEAYDAFVDQMKSEDRVQACYSISGESDFLVISHAPSLQDYENWARREIMSNPAISRYDTTVVWSCKKLETRISLDH